MRRYNINTFHELVESAEFVVEKEIYSGRILIKLSKIIKRRVGGMTEKESNLYNTFIYRKFVMPVLDRLLFLVDSLFNKKPNSIIGDEATLIALLRKEEIQ
ncbi:MAG: hypothetical protein DDT40_01475 [candidate division WS2 bacterium]|nr:hypothetical protein [Candidatus Psychracetigena formicireducens]